MNVQQARVRQASPAPPRCRNDAPSAPLLTSRDKARRGVKLIGANAQAIAKGEDRQLFKEAMLRIGLEVPRSGVARSLADVDRTVDEIGTFPLIIRPAFTLRGTGGILSR